MVSSLVLTALLSQSAFKPLPPAGIAIPESDRAALQAQLDKLQSALREAGPSRFAPDAAIFHKAVDWALRYNEIHAAAEMGHAKTLLQAGLTRAAELKDAPWTRATGLVPLGYVSQIDDSVQPYGLVVPAAWSPNARGTWRLDVWFHGRGETLSELNFLRQRMTQPGEVTPPDTFVLHLYGRYCNANKFAGEMDLFEALADVKRRYRIDDNRISVRGFSMGGAATWHVAAHHAGLWAVAAPGAGFAETQGYLKITNEQKNALPLWSTKLWNWYDATQYAANFFNTPVVAYSGELDRQIQAAQVMEAAMAREGIRLTHVVGPKTEHKYHPEAKLEIARRVDALATRGRVPVPRKLRLTTHTLRYNRMKWLTVDGLEEHWERARVDAEIRDPAFLVVRAENVDAFTLAFDSAEFPFDAGTKPTVTINGFPVQTMAPGTDLSWRLSFYKDGAKWIAGERPAGLRKRHGLQGPIDDAFMSRFLFVRPTGTPRHQAAHDWSLREMKFAATRWRQIFRGEVRVKDDRDVTDTDLAESHIILWGDSGSNSVWSKLAGKLPVSAEGPNEAVQLIYPNPLNPSRYVVTNSGFTFREESNATNSRQIPMLPDWAVVDITTPADGRYAGKVLRAGFFDEAWQTKAR